MRPCQRTVQRMTSTCCLTHGVKVRGVNGQDTLKIYQLCYSSYMYCSSPRWLCVHGRWWREERIRVEWYGYNLLWDREPDRRQAMEFWTGGSKPFSTNKLQNSIYGLWVRFLLLYILYNCPPLKQSWSFMFWFIFELAYLSFPWCVQYR